MTHKHYFLLSAIILISCFEAAGQNESLSKPVESLSKLIFMQGNWKGEGWILGMDRKVKRFSQSEDIEVKVDGQALVVDGLGHEIDSLGNVTDREIHSAFGIISLNADRGRVTMITFSKMYGRMESDMVIVGDKKLQWSFKEPKRGALIRFSEDFSVEGEWKEVGEVSMDGTRWHKFFEMTLKKVGSSAG